MDRSTRYVMLITSLPFHGPLFGARQTPLSRRRLNLRLRILEEADAQALQDLSSVLEWIHQSMNVTDAELVERSERLAAAWGECFLTDILRFRMEMRTLYTALRRRRRGETSPPPVRRWGFGRWVRHIERYWNEPGFRLQRVYPWINQAERMIEARDSLALERLLDGAASDLFNLGQGRGFSVKEVVEQASRITGRDIPSVCVDRRPGDPPVLVASHTKAEKGLNWRPVYTDLDDIISTAWNWHRKL
jgi:nucleoside-diphosphate-sugar epimerase